MATTIPFPFRPLIDAQPDGALKEHLLSFVEQYEGALGDEDKADEVENACFYEGVQIGLRCALATLLDVPNEQIEAYVKGEMDLDPPVRPGPGPDAGAVHPTAVGR